MTKAKESRLVAGLKYPTPASIKGRSSTIRAEFIKSVIPEIIPDKAAVSEALRILNQREGELKCSYCGGTPSEWDHFFSAVDDKKPTGYVTEVYNLVPSCGKCNQSKGSSYWKTWIRGTKAKWSPSSRIIGGTSKITQVQLEENIKALEAFEAWGQDKITKLDFEKISAAEFVAYFQLCEELIEQLGKYQTKAAELKAKVEQQLTR